MTTSDAVGFCKIKVASLIYDGGLKQDFEIFYSNKVAGKIKIKSEFEPEGGDKFDNLKK